MNSIDPESHLLTKTFSLVQKMKSTENPNLHPVPRKGNYETHNMFKKSYNGKTDRVNLFHSTKNDWDNTPVLKKKGYGYEPKKGKLSASSSDFYKTSPAQRNSNNNFSPRNDNEEGEEGIVKERVSRSKNPAANNKIASFNKTSKVSRSRATRFSPRNENDNENDLSIEKPVKSPVAKSKQAASRPASSDANRMAKNFSPRYKNDNNLEIDGAVKSPVARNNKIATNRPSSTTNTKSKAKGFSPRKDNEEGDEGIAKERVSRSKNPAANNKIPSFNKTSNFSKSRATGFSPREENDNENNLGIEKPVKGPVAKTTKAASRPASSDANRMAKNFSPRYKKDNKENDMNKNDGIKDHIDNVDIDRAPRNPVDKNKMARNRPSSSVTKDKSKAFSPRNQKVNNDNINLDTKVKSPNSSSRTNLAATSRVQEKRAKSSVTEKMMKNSPSEKDHNDDESIHSRENNQDNQRIKNKSVEKKPRSSVTKNPVAKKDNKTNEPISYGKSKLAAKNRVEEKRPKSAVPKQTTRRNEDNHDDSIHTIESNQENQRVKNKSVDKKPVSKKDLNTKVPSSSYGRINLAATSRGEEKRPKLPDPKKMMKNSPSEKDHNDDESIHNRENNQENQRIKNKSVEKKPRSSVTKNPVAKKDNKANEPISYGKTNNVAKKDIDSKGPILNGRTNPVGNSKVQGKRPSSSVSKKKAKDISMNGDILTEDNDSIINIPESPIHHKKAVSRKNHSPVNRNTSDKNKVSRNRQTSSVSKKQANDISISGVILTVDDVSIISLPESPIPKDKSVAKRQMGKNDVKKSSAGLPSFNRSSKQIEKPSTAADKAIKTKSSSKPVKLMPSKN